MPDYLVSEADFWTPEEREVAELKAERDALALVLAFYADRDSYAGNASDGTCMVLLDRGAQARAALVRLGAGVDETGEQSTERAENQSSSAGMMNH